jgi:hypothetical protein
VFPQRTSASGHVLALFISFTEIFMALSIKHHSGARLTQKQLDAIVPVLNKNMERPMGKNKFEKACETACSEAGVPIVLSLGEALEILRKFQYSPDGMIVDGPDAERHEAAMAFLDSMVGKG